MTAADVIGIELDNNTRQFTTISTVDSSTQVTIAAALTAAAAAGNSVFSYTTILSRPMKITSLRYKERAGVERELEFLPREKFFALPNRATLGPPSHFYYAPQLTSGKLYVWPTPNDAGDLLTASYIKTLDDFDAATDDPDLPQEWLDPVAYNLAVRIAPAFGISLSQSNPDVIILAKEMLDDILLWDDDRSPFDRNGMRLLKESGQSSTQLGENMSSSPSSNPLVNK